MSHYAGAVRPPARLETKVNVVVIGLIEKLPGSVSQVLLKHKISGDLASVIFASGLARSIWARLIWTAAQLMLGMKSGG